MKNDGSVACWGSNEKSQAAVPLTKIVETYSYDVFGSPTIKGPGGTVLTTSAVGNRFMFTGREYDSETSNYYYRARFYSPKIGRFLQTDPIGYAGGSNHYSYTYNNPINFRDPLGLLPGDPLNAANAEAEYIITMEGETVKQTAYAGARKTAADLAREGERQVAREFAPRAPSLIRKILAVIGIGIQVSQPLLQNLDDKQGQNNAKQPNVVPEPKNLVPNPEDKIPKPEDLLPPQEKSKLLNDIDDMLKLSNEMGLESNKKCLEGLREKVNNM